MKRFSQRILALLLSAFLVASAVSSGHATNTEPSTTPENAATRVAEVVSLRERNSETFLLSDGTYECVVYATDKYYLENDVYQEIDNSISPTSFSHAGIDYGYRNTANTYSAYFANNGTPSVHLERNSHTLSFSPLNTQYTIPSLDDTISASTGTLSDTSLDLIIDEQNTIEYKNIYTSTDLLYIVESDSVKEYIVLNDPDAPSSFAFSFLFPGLDLVVNDDGIVTFVDQNDDAVFSLGPLYAIDANGSYTTAVEYSVDFIDEEKSVAVVSVSVNDDYLYSSSRAYPVIVDPTVMITGGSDTYDTFVSSRYPTTNYYLNTYLRTGYDDAYYTRRTYIKFDIPSSIPADSVTTAYLRMEKYSGATPTIKAYRNKYSWSSSSLTWNTTSGFATAGASPNAVLDTGNWYKLNVKTIVSSWVNGTYNNYGFMICDSNEMDPDHWTTFYSSDASSPHKPELRITYTEPETPISINRTYSTYEDTAAYRTALQNYMNCYGYAIHVHSLGYNTYDGCYLQQPGEFAADNESYDSLIAEIDNLVTGSSATELLDFLEEKIYADFLSLSTYGDEWLITETTASASVPSGYRKIALTVGLNKDFHFYMRHSDGYWSHKPGSGSVTNLSFDTNVVITDRNISTVISEGGYDDGARYYLIQKAAIIDYAHNTGNAASSTQTTVSFLDCAGETEVKSTTITGSSKNSRLDFAGDIDFFCFTPTVSGTYTISTTSASDALDSSDLNMVIYDTYGNELASDDALDHPSITLSLVANSRYFIEVSDAEEKVGSYTLCYTADS